MEFLDKRITVVNVYGPSDVDNPCFFTKVFEYVTNLKNEYIIVGGDWNVILNGKLDARNYQSYDNRPKSRSAIKEIMNTFQIIDIWREIFPEKNIYIHGGSLIL